MVGRTQSRQIRRRFFENGIEPDLLSELSDDDLKDIGVASLGHRSRLLGAIGQLEENEVATNKDEPTSQSEQRSAVTERRQLTAMFCYLVGSTTLSRQPDPEYLNDEPVRVICAWQPQCMNLPLVPA